MPASILSVATKSFEQSDVLFFSGHQYAQYHSPGVFTNDATSLCFNIGAVHNLVKQVRVVVSTSCATICKDPAAIFNSKFPNAMVLVYRFSAPLNEGTLSEAFADKLAKKGALDLSNESDLQTIRTVWKSVVPTSGGTEGEPGILYQGQVEYFKEGKWLG